MFTEASPTSGLLGLVPVRPARGDREDKPQPCWLEGHAGTLGRKASWVPAPQTRAGL